MQIIWLIKHAIFIWMMYLAYIMGVEGAQNLLAGLVVMVSILSIIVGIASGHPQFDKSKLPPPTLPMWASLAPVLGEMMVFFWFGHPVLGGFYIAGYIFAAVAVNWEKK
jgi:hypothetical protein